MRYPITSTIIFFLIVIMTGIYFWQFSSKDARDYPRGKIEYSEPSGDVSEYLPQFEVGDEAPYKPGMEIQNGYKRVPPSKFYVYVWSDSLRMTYGCVYEECGKNGEIVASMRGWLYGRYVRSASPVKSLVIVADKNSKIVGVYPDKDISDLPNILAEHSDLADFNMLSGIVELADLKIGGSLPISLEEYTDDIFISKIKKPNFYIIVVHEKKKQGCPHMECGMSIDIIYGLNGWFTEFGYENPELERFGLDLSQVGRGWETLVVMADQDKKIVAIHPDFDMRDIFTVMAQHPSLVHFNDFPF